VLFSQVHSASREALGYKVHVTPNGEGGDRGKGKECRQLMMRLYEMLKSYIMNEIVQLKTLSSFLSYMLLHVQESRRERALHNAIASQSRPKIKF
jgi:hypothetical protein